MKKFRRRGKGVERKESRDKEKEEENKMTEGENGVLPGMRGDFKMNDDDDMFK